MAEKEQLFAAISNGDQETIRTLLQNQPSLGTCRNEAGVSAILFARYQGRLKVVEQLRAYRLDLDVFEAAAIGDAERVGDLVQKDAIQAKSFSSDGFTPLHLACFFGQVGAARHLLAAGADANASSTNGADLKPINSAAACRDLEAAGQIVELLLVHGADVAAKQKGGFTALHSASANGNLALVKLLLQNGADPKVLSDDNKTPLQFARERNRNDVVAILS